MTKKQEKPRNAGEAIYFAALEARQFSENLQPLLQLLEESPSEGGPGPLDQMTGLLTTIVTILAKHGEILNRLEITSMRPSSSSELVEMTASGS